MNFHNLNIHYSAPNRILDKLEELYKEMPEWDNSSKWAQWVI